ncbi:MAG: hypothetical protein ACFB9M_10460 [Myxococcota bacterium]
MFRMGATVFGAGGLVASFFLVEQADRIRWLGFGPALLVAVVGIGMMRWARRGHGTSDEHHAMGFRHAKEALERVVGRLDDIAGRPVPQWGSLIDDIVMPELQIFVDHRDVVRNLGGLDAYARTMDSFARGERTLNRVWSAAVDGYEGEARRRLTQARQDFEAAGTMLDRLQVHPG